MHGAVAQLGERCVRNAEVEGSIPFGSITEKHANMACFQIITIENDSFVPHGLPPITPVISGCKGVQTGQKLDKSSYPVLTFANAIDPVTGSGVLTLIAAGVGAAFARRNRTKAETDAERAQNRQAVQREVEVLAAEYHTILPRSAAKSIGAAYARYSTKYQNSIADQIRAIFKYAIAKEIFIPLDYIFYDLAVRGVKDKREGLDGLRSAMTAKKIEVALFFATNRLYRKMYRSMKFVEEELVERGIRGVFVSQSLDTGNASNWRTTLQFYAMVDEQTGVTNADNIIAALIGLVYQGMVSGSIPFGYQGEVIPGRLTRRGKPRRKLVVDQAVAHFVRQIFQWYVHDDVSIEEIARRLNSDPNCPPPPRASIHGWLHASVIAVLRNSIVRGLRAYGWTKRLWLSSKDYARQIPRDKPLVEVHDENYRIISDELFEAARVKLAADKQAYSRNYLRNPNPNPLSVMNGLFICGKHKQRIYFSGAHGEYGLCPSCRAEPQDSRGLFSHFPRKRALKQLCAALARRILNNDALVERIIAICQLRVEGFLKPDTRRVLEVEKRIEKVRRSIDFIFSNPGDNDEEEALSKQRLREYRQEKAKLEHERMRLQEAATKVTIVPDRKRVRELMSHLAEVLMTDATEDIEQARLLRRIINLITEGVVELYQMGEAKAHRGWLQGRFKLTILKALSTLDHQLPSDAGEDETVLTVDFRSDPKPKSIPSLEFQKEVKTHYEKNKPIKVIQKLMKCGYGMVDAALALIYGPDRKNRPHPNARRNAPDYAYEKEPPFRQIVDEVKALADKGLQFEEIAEALNRDRNTVTASWVFWHESRGLKAQDGRARRKTLNAKRKALAQAKASQTLLEGGSEPQPS